MNLEADAHGTAIAAALFDMDGVITDTAETHAQAWKRLFDAFLEARADRLGEPFEPFDERVEYRRYVDGKPRNDGVASFLAARGIEVPYGSPDDGPDEETVWGLARRKNRYFREWLAENRVRAYPGSIRLVRALRSAGIRVAVFSASRNAAAVLENAGVLDLFDALCDGTDLGELDLPGKPDPAMLIEAARRLDASAGETMVVEDAIAGVEAGARGGFALVVGVAREEEAVEGLENAGADLVVRDLAELRLAPGEAARQGQGAVRVEVKTLAGLPDLGEHPELLDEALADRAPAVFLDYDGTLTPIVRDHTQALLDDDMRRVVEALSRGCSVTIVSGRGLSRLKALVGLDGVIYVGSHGFEIEGPPGSGLDFEIGSEFLPDLDALEGKLSEALSDVPGHSLERKRFSLAVHYREVPDDHVSDLRERVTDALERRRSLRLGHGKKVFEIGPDLAWNKGHAVLRVIELMDSGGTLPIYVGDDITDEYAFHMLADKGLCIAVRHEETRQTAADYTLADTEAVQRLLEYVAGRARKAGHREGGG